MAVVNTRITRILAPALLAGALLALGACSEQRRGPPGAGGGKPVEVAAADRRPLETRVVVTGTLEAARQIKIINQEEGRILAITVREGDRVKKGDVLIRLDDALLRAMLQKASANRRQAELDLRRLEKLNRKKLASDEQLAQARTNLELARAEEALLDTRLKRTTIRAEFDGVISKRLREPGDVVPIHTHILTLLDPDDLRIRVAVSELLLTELRKGDPVSVRIDALGDARHPGRITRIHPTVDPDTRKGIVEVVLDPQPEGAAPGQLARLEIRGRSAERLVVPLAALRLDSQGEYVFRVVGGDALKVERARVQSGHRFGDLVEILAGLGEGERVVVRGFQNLAEGARVRIVEPAAAPPDTPGS